MSSPLTKFAKFLAEKVYKYFGNNSGNMLLATSIIGILTSCLAQTGAIILNKKYTDSQKMFMAPQELTEGCISILSIFFLTKPIQKLANNCLKSGKVLTKDMVEYLKKNELIEKRGKTDFDFKKSVNDIIHKIEASDEFIKSSSVERQKLIQGNKNIIQDFDIMSDSASAFATTFAGITASAFISPILRNHVASNFQKASLNYFNSNEKKDNAITNINFKSNNTIRAYTKSYYNKI